MNKFEGYLFATTSSTTPGLILATSGQAIKEFGLPNIDIFNDINQDYLSADFITKGEFSMITSPSILLFVGFLHFIGLMLYDNAHKSLNERHDDH